MEFQDDVLKEAKSKLADQEDDDDFFDDSHLQRQHRGSAIIEVDVIRRIFFSIPIPNGYGDWDGGISMHFTHIPNVSTYTVHLHIYYKPILVASLDLFL